MEKDLARWHTRLCSVTSGLSVALVRKALIKKDVATWPNILEEVALEIKNAFADKTDTGSGHGGDGARRGSRPASGGRDRKRKKTPRRKLDDI